ncbi:hypothetical protein DFH27DRAFT_540506 [Peziza echinospora]|nr:hypothetical protein DFH27DRAFT_540506 [Peziza echinospora]
MITCNCSLSPPPSLPLLLLLALHKPQNLLILLPNLPHLQRRHNPAPPLLLRDILLLLELLGPGGAEHERVRFGFGVGDAVGGVGGGHGGCVGCVEVEGEGGGGGGGVMIRGAGWRRRGGGGGGLLGVVHCCGLWLWLWWGWSVDLGGWLISREGRLVAIGFENSSTTGSKK